MKRSLMKVAVAAALLGVTGGAAFAGSQDGSNGNPYSPQNGHAYRHGAVPTREVHKKMKAWESAHPNAVTATSSNTLYYGGGTSSSSQGNVGVMTGITKVYLVFYGSGWGTQSTNANGDAVFSGDPSGAAPVTQEMFKGIGTGSELWSADLTQWCQGISSGASSCPTGTPASSFVPYQSGGILAGVWEDTSAATPINATGHQLALEAIKAAQHFGNTTAASNRNAYYVIMSAHGDNPDNYQSPTQGYCAWHDWNGDSSLSGGAASSSVGDLAFSNQPYNVDMGASCGVGFVNSPGTLDGYTMTLGHEWHEMASDQFPAGGWTATSGYENSDECAWIAAGSAGGAANVVMGTGTFTEQASWSNDTNACAITHPIVSHGSSGGTPTANFSFVTNGLTATFTDSSTDSGGTIGSHSWTFGDGATSTTTNPSHTYAAAGTYSVTETVKDSVSGTTNSKTASVTVASAGGTPTANFSFVTNGLVANFTDSSTDSGGTIGSHSWTFGDGATSTATSPSHTYAAAGTYSVTETVSDSVNGATNAKTASVTVSSGGGGGGNVLQNGVAVTGLSAATGGQLSYTMVVPAGATGLSFSISGGTGDADLYVKFGSAPTLSSYDCRPYITGNSETCNISNVQAGTYYVMLNGYAAFSGVSLVGSYTAGGGGGGGGGCTPSGTVLCSGSTVTGLAATTGNWSSTYSIVIPSGSTKLTVAISGSTGDADLYVRKGSAPTTSSYTCRPYLTGDNETCTISSPTAGATYYIRVRAYQTYSGVTLSTTIQ
ncbi:MAG TPA: pre-peptidase C-terminal domain-containing protein [Rudaea sp.]|nr:pre-peptidase C-terminal domain-containing protein [Rudaea sp.]